MKKQFIRTRSILCNGYFRSTLTFFLVTCSMAASSQTFTSNTSSSPATVTHLGNADGGMLFSVKMENKSGQKFSITIREGDNEALYFNTYREKEFEKKFKLPIIENSPVTFTIKSADGRVQSFEINTRRKMVEEMIVKKIS